MRAYVAVVAILPERQKSRVQAKQKHRSVAENAAQNDQVVELRRRHLDDPVGEGWGRGGRGGGGEPEVKSNK